MDKNLIYEKLKKSIQHNKLKLLWKRTGFMFKLSDVDDIITTEEEKDFKENLGNLISCFISNGEIAKDYVCISNKLKEDFPDFSNDILVKTNSYLKNLTLFNIKSIKSESNGNKFESYLVNLNFLNSVESTDTEESLTLELSSKDIKEIIEKLENILKK